VGLNNSSQQQHNSGGSKNKKKMQKPHSSDGNRNNVDKGGIGAQLVVAARPEHVLDPKFKDVICYNCGEPGHYVGLCTMTKRCFIYIRTGPSHG
jgi:hypothetical protein